MAAANTTDETVGWPDRPRKGRAQCPLASLVDLQVDFALFFKEDWGHIFMFSVYTSRKTN